MMSRKSAAPVPRLGLRERNKLEKLRRIKDAAKELFISGGYDDTTTREIARVADVGLGTLFTYASDKRDLLFLIINDDLEEMTRAAAVELSSHPTTDKKLRSLFRNHYAFFSRQPKLSRFMLREQQFYADTVQAMRFQATRAHLLALIQGIIERGQESGELTGTADPGLAARVLFGIYQMELRDWLAIEPLEIKRGMTLLQRSLNMVLQGLKTKAPRAVGAETSGLAHARAT